MRQDEINEMKAPVLSPFEAMFLDSGTKASLKRWWDAAEAELAQRMAQVQELKAAMDIRRHPRTVKGFLTKEQAWEAIQNATRDDMIYHGLTVVSDRKAFFLCDDCMLGFKLLPKDFVPCTFSLPLGTAHKTFNSIQEFCDHFCKDELYLSSTAELEDYLNHSYELFF